MKEITLSDSIQIVDPKLRAIAQRITKKVELAIEKAGANQQDPKKYPLAADPKSFEQIIVSRFKKLSPEKKKIAIAKIMSRINASKASRDAHYGDLAKIDLTKADSIEAQSKALPTPEDVKISTEYLKKLTNIHGDVILPVQSVIEEASKTNGLMLQATTDNLEFRIQSVRCNDRTSDGFLGTEATDEIRLGGITVDENGDTKTVSDFSVQTFSYDGQQKTYTTPLRFTNFNLNEGTFPKTYIVLLALAEADMGDFSKFISDLWSSVKVEVNAAVTGAISPILGPILASSVAFVLSSVVNLIIRINGDEVFVPATLSCTINSFGGTWDGRTDSPEHVASFTGFGGSYGITYDWRKYA